MKRRKFIGIIGISAAGLVSGGYISLSNFEKTIKRFIIEDTQSLKIPDTEIDKFMDDAQKENIWNKYAFPKKELIKWSYYLQNSIFSLPYHAKYRIYRSEIVGLFLLSTSFFRNKMDQGKPIQYIALYNPYFVPCSNPFSHGFYQ